MTEASSAGRLPASSVSLTGRALAAKQLAALEQSTGGLIEVLSESFGHGSPFVVSVETQGIEPGPGIKVRGRERFRIWVGDQFPFGYPSVFSDHRRWAGTPHVQWGSFLCLYAAGSVEWNASDGMRGLLDRLLSWLEHAAAGTLDPDDRPLHPPSNVVSATAGRMIVHPDLADRVPWPIKAIHATEHVDSSADEAAQGIVYAWSSRDGDRFDVLEWLSIAEVADRVLSADVAGVDSRGRRLFAFPLLMIDTDLGWEYPTTAKALVDNLERAGYDRREILEQLILGVRINRVLRMSEDVVTGEVPGDDGDTDSGFLDSDPVLFGLATPSRRIDKVRLPHIVAWKIDGLGKTAVGLMRQLKGLDDPPAELAEGVDALAKKWVLESKVVWVRVHEMRPEVTRRRDDGTSGQWLRERRVLLLGAGAIGAVVAEQAARAGVRRLVVVDKGVVTPGILVRQPFYDDDIGAYKVDALAERLNRIGRHPVVEPVVGNCHGLFLDGHVGGPDGFILDVSEFDLVIDATADAGTRAVIERVRAGTTDVWPPTVTLLLGHLATRGLAVVAGLGAASSSHELLRRFVVKGASRPAWADFVADFFPDPPRTEMFFPEPGCSEPTFVGSASDVMALSSALLGYSLDALKRMEGEATVPRMRVVGARLPIAAALGESHRNGIEEMTWADDLVAHDRSSGVEVRITAEALSEMRGEVRRGARVRGPRVETGGMMLGTFDEATGTATVDLATGPPPDSRLSETYFLNGVEGTQEALDSASNSSRGLTRFLGLWHSHPYGPARPSPTDRVGVAAITSFTPGARRALMVIIGGFEELWDGWVAGTSHGPRVYVRLLEADPTALRAGAGPATGSDPIPNARDVLTPYQRMLQTPPVGAYYEGGYSGLARTDAGHAIEAGSAAPAPQAGSASGSELSGMRRVLDALRHPGER